MIKKTDNNKDISKIKLEILNLKKSLINLNFQKSTGQLEKTSEIKFNRREIAKLNSKLSKKSGENNA